MPSNIFRNGGTKCDALSGSCACGATHKPEDHIFKFKEFVNYIKKNYNMMDLINPSILTLEEELDICWMRRATKSYVSIIIDSSLNVFLEYVEGVKTPIELHDPGIGAVVSALERLRSRN